MLEAGKVRIPTDKQSDEMKAFIKANPGGTYAIAGDNADKFRIDPQSGEVVSKTFMHFNGTDADLNTYGVDIIYTVEADSFTDKASVTLVNITADDNPTQAAESRVLSDDLGARKAAHRQGSHGSD